jgi:hypothetical protein
MHVRTTSMDLAHWLEREGGAWHVEGEVTLTASLPVPSPAAALVDVLRRRGGYLAVLTPDMSQLNHLGDNAQITARELSSAAHVVDGQRVFQLAWVENDGTMQDSWLLAEQRGQVPYTDDGSSARNVLRGAVSTVRRSNG